MRVFTELCTDSASAPQAAPINTTDLPFELRQRSRLHVTVLDGPLNAQAVGIDLPRGTVLRHGQWLTNSDGDVLRVDAADESLLVVHAQTPVALTTLAYHLGNRHVPIQIGENCLYLAKDNVLADMIVGLGGTVKEFVGPFEPESGAYRSGESSTRQSNGHHPHAHHHHGDEQHAPRIHDLSGNS